MKTMIVHNLKFIYFSFTGIGKLDRFEVKGVKQPRSFDYFQKSNVISQLK